MLNVGSRPRDKEGGTVSCRGRWREEKPSSYSSPFTPPNQPLPSMAPHPRHSLLHHLHSPFNPPRPPHPSSLPRSPSTFYFSCITDLLPLLPRHSLDPLRPLLPPSCPIHIPPLPLPPSFTIPLQKTYRQTEVRKVSEKEGGHEVASKT